MATAKPASYEALLAAAVRLSEDVALSSGGAISLRGLSVVEFVQVLRRFPAARDALLSVIGGAETFDQAFRMKLLAIFLDTGPEALAHVVATAAGAAGDQRFVDLLLALPDEDFMDLLEKAVRLTMPEGIADFFERLAGMAGRLGLAAGGSASPAQAA